MTNPSVCGRRCYCCFRPAGRCFCDRIPSISNRTDLLILQHARERRHAFNTARIVEQALDRCQLIHAFPRQFSARSLPIRDDAVLLYPSPGAANLEDFTAFDRPSQLVVIDGTWHHAKTMLRDVPALRKLPRVTFPAMSPSRFRIRREPTSVSLSTVEAVARALSILEPTTEGTSDLLAAFDAMVERQLGHPRMVTHWRKNARRRGDGLNLPKVLRTSCPNLVVAYGESFREQRSGVSTLFYWVAERIDTGETFECKITASTPPSEKVLTHAKLSKVDFAGAVSPPTFRDRWMNFLRPADTVATYHQSPLRQLVALGVRCDKQVVLKSIRTGGVADHAIGLDERLVALGVAVDKSRFANRAGCRLANAVAFVNYLRAVRGALD